jgi:uroporphyrinogen decarboxylase
MTSRERICAALNFEPPDRLPVCDALWDGLQQDWIQEGMPAEVSLADHFGWDIEAMFVDASARFDTWILSRGNGRITFEDRAGYTVDKEDGKSGTLHFLAHKTKTRDDWENLTKPRMVLNDPSGTARVDSVSYFCHLDPYPTWAEAKAKFDAIYARGRFVNFAAYGPWEATWRHRSLDQLLFDVLDEPDWCADMFATYTDLLIAVLQRSLDLGLKPDGLLLVEDMAFKTSLLISPRTWDALLRPCYERIRALLRRHDIRFLMHTDGRMWDLLPRLIEVGVEALNPFECAAGMDIAELRQRYPRQLTCYGNLSVTGLLGDRAALDAELMRKIPFAAGGGFILHSDHSIPFGVRYAQYRWACQRAQDLFASARQHNPAA